MESTTGITYHSEEDAPPIDTEKIRHPGKLQKLDDSGNISPANEILFTSHIYTNVNGDTTGNDNCISYQIPATQDGTFELTLKFVEPTFSKQGLRSFHVLLNGVTIMRNLDIVKFSGGRGIPLEIVTTYKISNNGKSLSLLGHSDTKVNGELSRLAFCLGTEPGKNGNISASAFSIVKLGPPITSPLRPDVCPLLEQDTTYCMIPGQHYAVAGGLCKNPGNSEASPENCKPPPDVILGVNFNGKNHTDSTGVPFTGEEFVKFDDPDKIRRHSRYPENPTGVAEDDLELFQTQLSGFTVKPGKDSCITYQVPVSSDGRYALTLKTLEPWYNSEGKRSFNIFFNGVGVLEEVDIFKFSGGKGAKMEIVVNYEVTSEGHSLILQGHPNLQLSGDQIPLAFCMGVAPHAEDHGFVISAFSVAKYYTPEDPSKTCSEPKFKDGTRDTKFLKTAKNSKYLYPEKVFMTTPNVAISICRKLKLEPATIQNLLDYKHLVDKLIRRKKLQDKFGKDGVFSALLGASDKDTTGVYREIETNEMISFQFFQLARLHYYVKSLELFPGFYKQIYLVAMGIKCFSLVWLLGGRS